MRIVALVAALAAFAAAVPAAAQEGSASYVLGLLSDPNGGPITLQHLDAATLEPSASLRIAWDTYNAHPLDRAGRLVAVRTTNAVDVVDSEALRVVRSYPLRAPRGAVCAVGLDGFTPVALLGCLGAKPHRYTIVRLGRRPARVATKRALDPIGYPVSFAFGDGSIFVSRAYGAVEAIDVATGTVSSHRPLRTLSKGEGFVRARWLGGHLLGLAGTIVDVRTWRRRTLAPHATETLASGRVLATYGTAGVAVFDRSTLRLYRRALRGRYVDQAQLAGGVLYARVGLVWDVIELRTGRTVARLVPDSGENLVLL